MMHRIATFLIGFASGTAAGFASANGAAAVLLTFTGAFAAGLLWVGLQQDEERRRAALPERPAWALAVTALSLPWLAQGVPLAWSAVALAVFGAAAGVMLAWVVLYAGVQKTRRLDHLAAWVSGAAAALAIGAAAIHSTGWLGLAAAAMVPWIARTPALRAADAAAPIPEHPLAGWSTTVWVAIAGVALGGGALSAAAPLTRQIWLLALAALVGGAWLAVWRGTRARRIALAAGQVLLVLVACTLARRHWQDGFAGAWLAPLALAVSGTTMGALLPLLCRFYATIPLGANILADIPLAERRAPNGSLLRIAVLCLALAAGPWLVRCLPVALRPLDLLLAAGVGLVLFDPRAGPGRKLTALVSCGVPAIVARWLWPG